MCLLAAVVGLPLTAATAYAAGLTLTVVTPATPPEEPPPCEENPDLPPCDQDPQPPEPPAPPEPPNPPEPEPCDDGRVPPPPCDQDPPQPAPDPPTCEEDPDQPRCDPCDVDPGDPRCDPCDVDPGDPRCDRDFQRPRVVDEFPRDGARNVSVFADVTAVFSEDVRGVDEDTFVLVRGATGTEVPANVFSRGDSDIWTLRPLVRLREGTRYTAELEGGRFGIRDLAGNDLLDTDWSFSTAGDRADPRNDFRRPRVVNEHPRDGARNVSVFTDVRAHFSEAVRGVTTTTFRLFEASTGDRVAARVFSAGSSRRWVLEPDGRLARFTRYVVALRGGEAGIRDLAGNRLFTTTWTFRTSG